MSYNTKGKQKVRSRDRTIIITHRYIIYKISCNFLHNSGVTHFSLIGFQEMFHYFIHSASKIDATYLHTQQVLVSACLVEPLQPCEGQVVVTCDRGGPQTGFPCSLRRQQVGVQETWGVHGRSVVPGGVLLLLCQRVLEIIKQRELGQCKAQPLNFVPVNVFLFFFISVLQQIVVLVL